MYRVKKKTGEPFGDTQESAEFRLITESLAVGFNGFVLPSVDQVF